MEFYIDIEDSSGVNYGSGPIVSATSWKSTKRVDRSGDFEFVMPAADEKATLVQKHRYATCYAILDSGPTEIGSGIIDKVTLRPGADGNVMLAVSGDDILRELAWRSVEFMQLVSGTSPVTHSVAVANLAGKLPAGWSTSAAASPPNNDIYYIFAGETCLAAAIKIAELTRCHVWMNPKRTLKFDTVWPSSGLRAIEAPVNPDLSDANTCFIESLESVEDTYDLISRILPYGAEIPGVAGSYVSLFNTSKSAPVGYTLDTANKYLKRDATETTYGRIEGFTKFNDIKANSSGAADIQSAANQLFDVALYVLQRRSDPAQFYRLRLAHCNGLVTPFQTIRTIFRRVAEGRNVANIDATLYIMGATVEVDADGVRTTDLEVATVDRWADTDTAPVAEAVRNNLRIS